MSPREKLQMAYEIAFFPPRIHLVWNEIKRGAVKNRDELVELLDMALSLHQALPESGFQSYRALKRLANYQADSRMFGTVTFLKNIRDYLGLAPLIVSTVPAHFVRDIGLPEFRRSRRPGETMFTRSITHTGQ